MEVIALAGYTEEEKLQIAKRYLVPRQIERNGSSARRSASATPACGDHHLVHARGRRTKPRARGRRRVPQGRARRGARQARAQAVGHRAARAPLLGRPRFHPDVRRRTAEPGVATGLAWTPVGGDVLFVEASAMPGKGKLTITGQLGDVMRESAEAALSVRARPLRHAGRLVRQARRPRARAGRGDPEGRPERPASRWRRR